MRWKTYKIKIHSYGIILLGLQSLLLNVLWPFTCLHLLSHTPRSILMGTYADMIDDILSRFSGEIYFYLFIIFVDP